MNRQGPYSIGLTPIQSLLFHVDMMQERHPVHNIASFDYLQLKGVIKLLFFLFSICFVTNIAQAKCTGRFVNPITDVCWSCMFPIHIAGVKVVDSKVPETKIPDHNPVCVCDQGPIAQIGLPLSFWEPVRLVDVSHTPYCFPNLGGITIDLGISVGQGSKPHTSGHGISTWHLHWYVYPLLYWLELLTNFTCMETADFSIGYLTELDPLWLDDSLSAIINPEAALFGNIIAQSACIADCGSATTSLPQDALFWCAGCQGSLYPMNGRVKSQIGSIQSALLAVERMTYKLHREGILWSSLAATESGLFGKLYGMATGSKGSWCKMKRPMPFMKKSMYRSQTTVPVPSKSCYPYGRSTTLYESGKEVPVIGEDFGFLIWRKRECCAF